MNRMIIAISREFGSGGHVIGEAVAKRLSIAFYDKILLQLAAEKSGMCPKFIEQSEQKASSSFLFNLATAAHASSNFFYQHDLPVGDRAFFAQAEVVREIAAKESAVIIGRGADHVLRDNPDCLRIFLWAPLDFRLSRIMEIEGLPEREARAKIAKTDKARANYYRHYTGQTWGDVRTHDLCINVARGGIEGTVDLIYQLAKSNGQ